MTSAEVEAGLDVPAGWETRTDVGDLVLLARPPRWERGPAPTLTVSAAPAGERPAPFAAYVDEQLAGLASLLPGATLLHLDTPPASTGGRVLELALAQEALGADLTTLQRHLVEPSSGATTDPATGAVRLTRAELAALVESADASDPRLAPVLATVRAARTCGVVRRWRGGRLPE